LRVWIAAPPFLPIVAKHYGRTILLITSGKNHDWVKNRKINWRPEETLQLPKQDIGFVCFAGEK
jgi:hypothetical protein